MTDNAQKTARRIVAAPVFLYVCVLGFGAIGACARYGLIVLFPDQTFPQSTLLINLFGCYVIYLIFQWFGRRMHLPHNIVRGMGIGLVGAFTTLSAFNIECLTMLQTGQYALFATYETITFFGTFAASLAGWGTYNLLVMLRVRKLRKRKHALHLRFLEEQRAHAAAEARAKATAAAGAKASATNRTTNPVQAAEQPDASYVFEEPATSPPTSGGEGR